MTGVFEALATQRKYVKKRFGHAFKTLMLSISTPKKKFQKKIKLVVNCDVVRMRGFY